MVRTSERLSEQEIRRCMINGGPMAGRHLAALERQKSTLAAAERHAALKANPPITAAAPAGRQTANSFQIWVSRWLGSKLIAAGHRLAGAAT